MDHIQDTNVRMAPQRRKMDYPFDIKEEIKATERLNAQKVGQGVQRSVRKPWFSSFQGRLWANPGPFFLIGSGLMIGWISVLRDRRRRQSIIMRDFSDVSEEIDPGI